MEFTAIWALIRRLWPLLIGSLLILICVHLNERAVHWHDRAMLCQQARLTDQANYRSASEKAADTNKAEVLAVQTKYQQAADQTAKEYNANLAQANARVAAYVQRMRSATAQANPGGTSGSGVPTTAKPASGTDGTGEAALIPVPVSDLNICAENTQKASSWQAFWAGVVASQPPLKPATQ